MATPRKTTPAAAESAAAPASVDQTPPSSGLCDLDAKSLMAVLTAVQKGDFSARLVVEQAGVVGRVADTLNAIIAQNEQFTAELERVGSEVGKKGRLAERVAMPGVSGGWRAAVGCVNELIVDLSQPVAEVERVIGAVAKGDLSQQVDLEGEGRNVRGEFRRTAKMVNTMVDQLSAFASEVTRVAREVGTEGKLGGQAKVPGVSGTWKDLTDNVNSMAGNLTGQVRNIADVTTAVANGDLSKKITVEAEGEILELKNTVNTMVDQLQSFASEVTRVAREVGTEGKLGGQAEVSGVSGTWKDLTGNVNQLAGNLTAQVRNIAEVTTAVANGDLSRKITVEAQGEIAELKTTINRMVDQLQSFASEVTRVAREVGTEGQLGGQAAVPGVSGTWKDLTDNVNYMAGNLTAQVRNIADVTTAVANGDLSKEITVEAEGEILELKNTINTMVDQLSAFASEVTRVAREVGSEGKLGGQARVEGVSGTWKELTDNVNYMAGDLTTQVRTIAEVTTAVANGDLSKKITIDVKGEILELKNTINTMVDQLSAFASEVTRVAREVGTEGELGGQAKVPGVSGTWKDLTDNVNQLAGNLTAQVRNIADVTTAVANGDLSKKITVDVKGEILELKVTINRMVDQLSGFASEVTRVAREVGTEGRLGGQAEVPGVSGTWKDLTDNVNSMADNLTAQVRGVAEVVTAVARGDLDQKLQVVARGEIAELRDTINGMTSTLDLFAEQVTGVAREVGVEGRLGGQAEVPGASGTWRALTDNVNQLAANLTTQVRAITEVTQAVTAGDLSKTITVEAAGEVAGLKDNVNEMIRNLKDTTRVNQEQDWLKTNLARFTQRLQGQKELVTAARLILSELAPLVHVQHGAFYTSERILGDGEQALRLLATYAYRERKGLANRFALGEGLVGQCALEKERILVTDLPDDYVQINSGLGASSPRSIVVLPVLFEGEVMAVVELASFQPFSDNQLVFLDQLTESIGIVLNSIEANMRTESLLLQSQGLTQELQSRQDELQQTNTELEEKAQLLAEQNAEVERKNVEIEQARTAIEEKAEQLALTSKYKSEFLANMSHELRTPLNSMLILSRMLAENADSVTAPKKIEYAETIHSSGSDLLNLINEILDLSKIESGSMPVEVEPVGLDEVERDVERLFREVANDRGLAFEVDIEASAPDGLDTDPKRLQQVLKNLLSNAFKFTHDGGVTLRIHGAKGVRFRTEALVKTESVVGFSVTDTGIGIAPEKQRVIFEAFQQAESSTDRTYGGTGLGLSISREIARLLGGEIHLQSAPGVGSTFTLYLPAQYAPPAPRTGAEAVVTGPDGDDAAGDGYGGPTPAGPGSPGPRPASPRSPSAPTAAPTARATPPVSPGPVVPGAATERAEKDAPGSAAGTADEPADSPKKTARPRSLAKRASDDRDQIGPDDRVMLIVEDDPRFAGILVEVARERGFKAVVAGHAEAALADVRRFRPAAITLDIQLPGMHGLALLDRLKNTPETRHIPVQIVSVADQLPRRERKGALGQLQKPVKRAAVGAAVDKASEVAGRPIKRLLVVEDNEAQRQIVADFIGGEDVEIVGAATGAEALAALGAGAFDCVLVDLGLPDMTGFELIDLIRGSLGLADLPVIVHTGRELTDDEASRLHLLAEAVVVKGVEAFDRLLDETALHLHRVEAALPEAQRERLEQRHRPESALAGHKVLIVDDDVRNIFALQSLLELHKMEVVYAESGREAIETLQQADDVDVVLMDVMMPGMDGYKATRIIRQDGRFATLPIIAVTAKAMEGDREKCLDAGASDYLTKPVNVDQLTSLLRVWVGKR
ncbi:MAG TPA: HAMP domain-containing protein [Rubricoccaceae bacterium]|jgi:HAMP domain-containing protein/signal transduction histidine kinase/CheY-like chemotaxis protein